jgi:hypothetical protein
VEGEAIVAKVDGKFGEGSKEWSAILIQVDFRDRRCQSVMSNSKAKENSPVLVALASLDPDSCSTIRPHRELIRMGKED